MKNMRPFRFSLLERFMENILSSRHSDAVMGDFIEIYEETVRTRGKARAMVWVAFLLGTSMPKFILQTIYWSFEMLKNYIKTGFRFIKRQKGSSFLNIAGLSTGFVCSLLIFLWVKDEQSFDRFHAKADRTYRVVVSGLINDTEIAFTLNPVVLADVLLSDFPEVENAVRIYQPRQGVNVRYKENRFMERNFLYVEKNFFDIFSFPLVKGNPQEVLEDTKSIVLTEKTARKYFGNEDPVGKSLTFGRSDLKVTGIVKDVPHNSHFTFDLLRPISFNRNQSPQWMNNWVLTYLVLKEGAEPGRVDTKFPQLIEDKIGNLGEGNRWEYHLQAITDIHLHSHMDFELGENGNVLYVTIFSVIAVFIIVIACINFINLTSAKASTRAREVGIRKVAGSHRMQLVRQFLLESLLQTFIALVLASGFLAAVMPAYTRLVAKPLSFGQLLEPATIAWILGLTALVGILSGSYPAFLLSSFRPVTVFKGDVSRSGRKSFLRNGLVIFQFCVSVILIIGTLIVFKQLRFIKSKNLGFNKEQVLIIRNPHLMGDNADVFKQELVMKPQIRSAGFSSHLPGCNANFIGIAFEPEGSPSVSLETWSGDENLLETLQIELSRGRSFSREFPSDNRAIILNEAAVKLIGWEKPLGKKLRSFGEEWTVIGVMKNINHQSLRFQVRPMGLLHFSSNFNDYARNYMAVRFNPGNVASQISTVREVWDEFAEGFPFEYSFLDEEYASLYQNEQKTGKLSVIFSLMSIFIATLGLFGLASFTAIQRTKEVGIRKVLGASAAGITSYLVKDFLLLVAAANIIAIPAAYILMNRWLNNFAYHADISWWIFLVSSVISLFTACFTVGFRTIKAALANPADSLRYE